MNPMNTFALMVSYWRLQFSAAEMWIAWWSVAWRELNRPGLSGERSPSRPSLAIMYRETMQDTFESADDTTRGGS